MDREQYEEAKRRLGEITSRLKYEQISAEERDRLEKEGARLARVMMSPWIPFSWGHRIGMMVIVAIGFWGLTQGQSFLALIWLALPLFSPRIVGEFLNLLTGFNREERRQS